MLSVSSKRWESWSAAFVSSRNMYWTSNKPKVGLLFLHPSFPRCSGNSKSENDGTWPNPPRTNTCNTVHTRPGRTEGDTKREIQKDPWSEECIVQQSYSRCRLLKNACTKAKMQRSRVIWNKLFHRVGTTTSVQGRHQYIYTYYVPLSNRSTVYTHRWPRTKRSSWRR